MSEPSSVQTRAFKILQANVNGDYLAQIRILEFARDEYLWDVILLQEASRLSYGFSAKKFGYFRLACSELPEDKGKHISTCVYVRTDNPLGTPELVRVPCSCEDNPEEDNLEDSKWHEEHICTFAFDLGDGRHLYVTNTYNRISAAIPEDCLTSFVDCEGLHFNAGDWNLHHRDWAADTLSPNFRVPKKTERIRDKLRSELKLLTPPGKSTFHRRAQSSVLDLTWASHDLEIERIRYLEKLETPGMDITPIETTFNVVCQFQPKKIFLWHKADEAHIKIDMGNFVSVVMHSPTDDTCEIERHVRDLVAQCRTSTTAHVPCKLRTYHDRSKPVTEEIVDLKLATEIAQAERLRSRKDTEHHWAAAKSRHPHLKNFFWAPYHIKDRKWRQLYKKWQNCRKTQSRIKYRSDLLRDTVSFWKRHRYAAARGRAPVPQTMPSLEPKDLDGLKEPRTVGPHGKVSALHKEWYTPRESCVDSAYFCQHLSDSDDSEPVHQLRFPPSREVRRSTLVEKFAKLRANRAPGDDEIGNPFLLICADQLVPYLALLITACLQQSYFPDEFKTGKTVAIPKSMKPGYSYSDPEMWRPICLLSSLGKLFKSCIADILSDMADKNEMLPPTQMATKGRSTEDALRFILEIIETARNLGLAVSVMCLDHQGAFNLVHYKEVKRVFRRKGVPSWFAALIESYLDNRRTTINIPGYESEVLPCGGSPQGGPASPSLFSFFTCGLLEKDPSCSACQDDRVFKMAFSDDTYIIAIGESLITIKTLLKKEFAHCQEWAHASGTRFGVEKTKVIHFASPNQYDAGPMSEFIEGFNDDEKHEGTSLKVLGVLLKADKKGNFSWTDHYEHLKVRARKLQTDFSRIVRMTNGLDVISALRLYKGAHRSTLTYACGAWYEPSDNPWFLDTDTTKIRHRESIFDDPSYVSTVGRSQSFARDSARRAQSELLDGFQNRFLCMILGAFKRVPRPYLSVELHIEPLSLYVYRRSVTTRANKMDTDVFRTIMTARDTVIRFGLAIQEPSSRTLRSRHVPRTIPSLPTYKLDNAATIWRDNAIAQLNEDIAKDQNAHTDSLSAFDDAVVTEVANEIAIPLPLHGISEDTTNVVHDKAEYARKLKDKIRINSQKWADNIMEQTWKEWCGEQHRSLSSKHPTRPKPAVLDNKWGRQNLMRYQGLNRPVGSMLFQLRSE